MIDPRHGVRWMLVAIVSSWFCVERSAAGDAEFCEPLTRILAAAPREFRALKSEEYSTKFESWRARETLAGFDACWVDDVRHGFWCLHQAPNLDAAARLGSQTIAAVTGCYPIVRRQAVVDTMDNDLTRTTTEWMLDDTRRIRVVERRSTSGRGIASVFLYVY